MTFAAQMRLGSLEVVAALTCFALAAGRFRSVRPSAPPLSVELDVLAQSPKANPNRVALTVAPAIPKIIGRSHEADVALDDPEVSRRHAKLQAAGGILYASDLGSVNGTFLNGKRLNAEGIEVRAGDTIDVGNSRIVVRGVTPAAWA